MQHHIEIEDKPKIVWYNRWWAILIFIFVILAIANALINPFNVETTKSTPPDIRNIASESAKQYLDESLISIHNKFSSDSSLTDLQKKELWNQQYKDKLVKGKVYVHSIDEVWLEGLVMLADLSPRGPYKIKPDVRVEFDDFEKYRLMDLSEGDSAWIEGTLNDYKDILGSILDIENGKIIDAPSTISETNTAKSTNIASSRTNLDPCSMLQEQCQIIGDCEPYEEAISVGLCSGTINTPTTSPSVAVKSTVDSNNPCKPLEEQCLKQGDCKALKEAMQNDQCTKEAQYGMSTSKTSTSQTTITSISQTESNQEQNSGSGNEQIVSVPGTSEWYDTGININSVDTIIITASGNIKIAGSDYYGQTPDGVIETSSSDIAKLLCPSTNRKYSLIGKIGSSGSCFVIGSSKILTASSSGTLYLSVNDRVGTFWDNSGSWTVNINIT